MILEPAAPAQVERNPQAAAFFDVDNTIVKGASLYYFAKGLYRRKFFSTRELIGGMAKQVRFQFGGENMEDIEAARAGALAFIKDRRVAEVQNIAEEIWDEYLNERVWPGTRTLAQRHIAAGERVWIVTAAPVEMAEVIARQLGLTGAMGTVAESRNGVYTGRLVGDLLHRQAKVDAIKALAVREGLDLAQCSAYSDSAHDIPMLSLVGHPCAVNPDRDLRAYAREHGWAIKDYQRAEHIETAARAATAGAVFGALGATGVAVMRRRRRSRMDWVRDLTHRR